MLKLVVSLLVLGVAFASVHDNELPSGNVHVEDIVMVRGANGQLETLGDRLDNMNVCDTCKSFVGKLDDILHDAQKLEKFKDILKMMCDYLAGQEADECKIMVDNIDALINRIEPYLKDPATLCAEIGLCQSSGEDSVEELPRYVKLVLLQMANMARHGGHTNDMLCDECQFAVNELKQLMAEGETKEEAMNALDSVCQAVFSGDSARKCVSIVNQYFPLVWDELRALIDDSHAICVDLDLCSSITGAKKRPIKLIRLLPAVRRVSSSDEIEEEQRVDVDDELDVLF
jgi:hypothetical protein